MGAYGRIKKRAMLGAVLSGGEGGRDLECYTATRPMLLSPGTTVKEALLIIDYRLNAKEDED
jgi:hypothetical protein